MRIVDPQFRLIIREEITLMLSEGVFDGTLGAGKPTTPSAAEKAAAQATELALSKKVADSGVKKLAPAIKDVKAAVEKADPEDLKKMVKNWGKPAEPQEQEVEEKDKTKVTSSLTQPAALPAAQAKAQTKPQALSTDPKELAAAELNKQPEKPFEKQTQAEKIKSAAKVSAAALKLSQSNGGQAREMAAIVKDNPAARAAFAMTPGMTDLQASVDANLKAKGKDPLTAVGDAWRELGQMTSRYGLAEARHRWIENELRKLSERDKQIHLKL
jgi:hypothetical protein